MSVDQQLFQELSEILIKICPDTALDIHFVGCVWPNYESYDLTFWFGEKLSGSSSFSIKNLDQFWRVADILKALHGYFHAEELGNWNIMHLVIVDERTSFRVDFERSVGLESGDFSSYDYMGKYR